MKKCACFIGSLALIFALSGCGGNAGNASSSSSLSSASIPAEVSANIASEAQPSPVSQSGPETGNVPSDWISYTLAMGTHTLNISLPPQIIPKKSDTEIALITFSSDAPTGFLVDETYVNTSSGAKVGVFLWGENYGRYTVVNEDLYQRDGLESISDFTASDSLDLKTFFHYEEYVVFIDHKFLPTVDFCTQNTGFEFSFWLDPQHRSESIDLFKTIMSTVVIS